jgi:hypothetical protein
LAELETDPPAKSVVVLYVKVSICLKLKYKNIDTEVCTEKIGKRVDGEDSEQAWLDPYRKKNILEKPTAILLSSYLAPLSFHRQADLLHKE